MASRSCPGAPAPTWQLHDFQPQSCGHDQIYGLDRFAGEVVVVFLWQATCSFCHSQLLKVERCHNPLDAFGLINKAVHPTHNQGLTRCIAAFQHLVIDKPGFSGRFDTAQSLHGIGQLGLHLFVQRRV